MHNDDQDHFFELLDLTYDIIGVGQGKFISGAAKAMFFEDLKQYPIEFVEKALTAHRQDPERGKFTPKPADVIYQIERRMPVQWISADECWSMMPKIEGQPAILNQVTAVALAAAIPLLEAGEDTAARMAFKGAYQRLVEKEKLARRPPVHWLSPGGTVEEQQAVASEGVRLGLLPPSAAPAQQLLLESRAGMKRLGAALKDFKPKDLPGEEHE